MTESKVDFYDEMRTLREPWVGRNARFDEACTSWAQNVVKASFSLNGGGLVALPALGGLFHNVIAADPYTLFRSAASYALGLTLAAMAGVCGYFTAAWGEAATLQWVEHIEQGVRIAHGVGDNEKLSKRQAEIKAFIKASQVNYRRIRSTGIILALSSIGAFIIGTGLAYPALLPNRNLVSSENSISTQQQAAPLAPSSYVLP